MSLGTVLVTGAGRRNGLHLAKTLLAQGYAVIAHYRQTDVALDELKNLGAQCLQADFCNAAQLDAMLDTILAKHSSLRAIIHNASTYVPTEPDVGAAAEQFDVFYQTHMRAPFLITERLKPLLLAAPQAHSDVVFFTDIYASRPRPDYNVYCSTKAGLANLALSFAKQLAPKVKVNCIAPGLAAALPEHSQAHTANVLANTLIPQATGWQPLADTVLAILNNAHQTGSTVTVDGGRSLLI